MHKHARCENNLHEGIFTYKRTHKYSSHIQYIYHMHVKSV